MATDPKHTAPSGEVTLSEEQQKRYDAMQMVRSNIHREVYEGTRKEISGEVDRGVQDVRDGVIRNEAGEVDEQAPWYKKLWAFLKSLIFKIAEAFGFEKGLAKMFGSPIPDGKEVTAISNQVANTVSLTLTDPEFTFNDRAEFEKNMGQRIFTDLKKKHGAYASFSDEQLAKLAQRGAHSVANAPEFSAMFDKDGKRAGNEKSLDFASPVQGMAMAKFTTAFDNAMNKDKGLKEKLAQVSGKADFGKADAMAISQALAPTLVELNTDKELKSKSPEAAFDEVSGKIRQSLIANKAMLNREGAKWDDAKLAILADRLTVEYMASEMGVQKVPDTFTARMQKAEGAIVEQVAGPEIEGLVQGAMSEKVAVATMKSYFSSVTGAGFDTPTVKNLEELQKFYDKDAKGDYTLKRGLSGDDLKNVATLHKEIHAFAAKDGWTANYAPTMGQRDEISTIVSQTAIEVLKDPQNKDLTQSQLAAVMEVRIRDNLKAHAADIDAKAPKGHTIEAVNKKNTTSKILGFGEDKVMDIFSDVAKGFANTIRDDQAAFGKLDKVRSAFHSKAKDSVLSALDKDGNHVLGASDFAALGLDSNGDKRITREEVQKNDKLTKEQKAAFDELLKKGKSENAAYVKEDTLELGQLPKQNVGTSDKPQEIEGVRI